MTKRVVFGGVVLIVLLQAAAVTQAAPSPSRARSSEPSKPPATLKKHKVPPTPEHVKLSPLVKRVIDDPITSDAQRRRLRIFHGQWDELPPEGQLSLKARARLALLRGRLDAPVLRDARAPALLRARAAMGRGRPGRAVKLVKGRGSARAALVRARAFEQLGRYKQAERALQPWRKRLASRSLTDPAELTAAARALAELASLEGRPARDDQLAMDLLARVRQKLDPLYWPAYVAEGRLLIAKDNRPQGAKALLGALSLNPKAGEAWYRLGLLAVDGYDFDKAALAVKKLRAINPDHPLANLLEARSLLQQRDVEGARKLVEAGLERYPTQRRWLALHAAVAALNFNHRKTRAALDRFDKVAPGNPLAYQTVGRVLSSARQYDLAAHALHEAIRRRPHQPAPHVALGLLLMQSGDLPAARTALARAVELAPFNRRAHNQLSLVRDLLDEYETYKTPHFVIRYKPGRDRVLARDMRQRLEKLYHNITGDFDHRPGHKTQIDIMPDERYFAVRVTGMPEIWTVAASTGDVIALTPPRHGPHQRGPYDWVNVIRHEFTHTVTLDQSDNRVAHWFTEACAVREQTTGRNYKTCKLLAFALHHDKLFKLDQINWGFIRPKTPLDRPLAYGQAAWMLEYLTQTRGREVVAALLERFRRGERGPEAIRQATGEPPARFMSGFKRWAAGQVERWGLAPPPDDDKLRQVIAKRTQGFEEATAGDVHVREASPEEVRSLLAKYPDQPDLLKITAKRAVDQVDQVSRGGRGGSSERVEAARRAVKRYAKARPVDPWAQRALVKLAAAQDKPAKAASALRTLARRSESNSRWAYELARIRRSDGRLDAADHAVKKAVRTQPYNVDYRQLAATIDLQHGDAAAALYQLQAAAMLEPKRAIHQVRLAALYHKLGRDEEAKTAAKRARELSPRAPVERFLK